MNSHLQFKTTLVVYVIGIFGSFLILAGLVRLMYHYTHPAPVGQERAEFRKKNLATYRSTVAEALANYGWVDQSKGIVRLPVDQAIELTLQQWKDPAAARSNLISRAEKAYGVPPATTGKNAFE
jgi:hypothetical protein